MNLLQLQKGSKHFGLKTLFDQASFSINEGEHMGVIGPNGAGKTTLFKILVGQESLDSGEVTFAQGLRVGYLEQEADWSLEQSAEEFLATHCPKPIWELKRLGLDLGLSEDHFRSRLKELSGGYRMRMKLLKLIGDEPHLMLLDEPTNFLDLESVLVLENFLQGYDGAFLMISHDREFLKRTTESTLEVEAGDITKFPGHIDDYFEQKTQLREIIQAQAANLEAKRKHMQDFVDRFRAKATKAKQAQSRLKQLDKMDSIELKDLPVRARIQIPAPIHTGKESLSLQGADLGYEGAAILQGVSLSLERGAHLGVVGHNGAGKSTLLKSLAGRLPLISGDRRLGYQVTLSYFSQHLADQLDLNDTVLQALQSAAHPQVTGQEILNMAGSLLFSGDDVHKKIRVLSGGEKSRVALGQILLKKSPLILMDEPTNHLDFETVEAMTEALRDYTGTVIVVSHDRSFIRRVSTKILEIHHGRVEVFPGTYDDYVWSLQKGALKDRAEQAPVSTAAARPAGAMAASTNGSDSATDPASDSADSRFNYRDRVKALQSETRDLKKKIAKQETQLQELTSKRDRLTQDLLSAQGATAQTLAKDLGLCSNQIESIEIELLECMESLDTKEKELALLRE